MDAMSDVSNVAVMMEGRGRERGKEGREGRGRGRGRGRERDDHERGDIPIASMCRS